MLQAAVQLNKNERETGTKDRKNKKRKEKLHLAGYALAPQLLMMKLGQFVVPTLRGVTAIPHRALPPSWRGRDLNATTSPSAGLEAGHGDGDHLPLMGTRAC